MIKFYAVEYKESSEQFFKLFLAGASPVNGANLNSNVG